MIQDKRIMVKIVQEMDNKDIILDLEKSQHIWEILERESWAPEEK